MRDMLNWGPLEIETPLLDWCSIRDAALAAQALGKALIIDYQVSPDYGFFVYKDNRLNVMVRDI